MFSPEWKEAWQPCGKSRNERLCATLKEYGESFKDDLDKDESGSLESGIVKSLLLGALILTAVTAGAAGKKMIPLDDGHGHFFGYVIPTEVVAVSGDTKTSRATLKNGATFEIPVDVTYTFNRINNATAGVPGNKMIPLDDGLGHFFGYVIPTEVVAVSGDTKTSRVTLKNGAMFEIPVDVTYTFNRINNAVPPGPAPAASPKLK
jgi:hypothetical protein